jgi:HK97 family phage prohead protease
VRFPNGTERRAAVELRVAGRRLEGYASVFNSPTRIGDFEERVIPGAFRASLAGPGAVLALVDHDMTRLLARTSSGTLRLGEDARGLAFSLDVPDTQLGHDVLALAERRDIGGASFGFRVTSEAWPARDRRELRAVELLEVSIVHAHPAYGETSVSARSRLRETPAEVRRRRSWLETL